MSRLIVIACLLAVRSFAAITVYHIPGDYAATEAGYTSAVQACATASRPAQPDPAAYDDCFVVLAPGTVISINNRIVHPAQTSEKFIHIRTDGMAGVRNRRVAPGDSGTLAKFTFDTGGANFELRAGDLNAGTTAASHYAFEGFEISVTSTGVYTGLINLSWINGNTVRHLEEEGRSFVMEKLYLHGPDNLYTTPAFIMCGLNVDASNVLIRDNHFRDMLGNGGNGDLGSAQEGSSFVTQGSPGGLYFINNRIASAGIGTITGGTYSAVGGIVTQGQTYYGNVYTTDPKYWTLVASPSFNPVGHIESDDCYVGSYYKTYSGSTIWQCQDTDGGDPTIGRWNVVGSYPGQKYMAKNGLELKNGRDVWIEGNVFRKIPHDRWSLNQDGAAFLANAVDQCNSTSWKPGAAIEDVTIQNNFASETGTGFVVTSFCTWDNHINWNRRIKIRNNFLEAIGHVRVGPWGNEYGPAGMQMALQLGHNGGQTEYSNNTHIQQMWDNKGFGMFMSGGTSGGIDAHDNIIVFGDEGFKHEFGGSGDAAWDAYLVSGSDNLVRPTYLGFIDGAGTHGGNWGASYSGVAAARHWTYAAGFSAARFSNFTASGLNVDPRLCTAAGVPDASCAGASPFATASSSGGPLGVDKTELDWAITGVEAGTADEAFLRFRIGRADKDLIGYSAYDSGACSGAIYALPANTLVGGSTWTDIGGDLYRTHAHGITATGHYRVRVTCADGRFRDKVFRVF